MKKIFYYLSLCLFFALGALVTSCSDDSDSPSKSSLVGDWRWDGSTEEDVYGYIFKKDGSFEYYDKYYSVDEKTSYYYKNETYKYGTYVLSGDELIMYYTKKREIYKSSDPIQSRYNQDKTEAYTYVSNYKVVSLTNNKLVLRYQYETNSGDVMSRTNSYTKVSN